jgi:hypothetical protein
VTGWLRAYWSKLAVGTAIAAVAAVAGVISYTHIYELTVSLHQTVMAARLMPFGVDGLIVTGSVVLLQSAPGQRWLGWLGIGPGVAINLFANVESGIRYGVLAAIWAGIPAVSFSLATFMLERWLKAQAGAKPVSESVPASAPEPLSTGTPAGVPVKPAKAVPGRAKPVPGKAGTAAPEVHFRDVLAAGELPSVRRIRRELQMGQPKGPGGTGRASGLYERALARVTGMPVPAWLPFPSARLR